MRNGYYEDECGNQIWYKNGKWHREDGPAYIGVNGIQSWWLNDKLHREDGPAVIYTDGYQEWFINDIDITWKINQWFEEFNLNYDTMEFEDKMALKFFIRGLGT